MCGMLITMCKSPDVNANMNDLCKHVKQVREQYEKACSMMQKSESIKRCLKQLPCQHRVFEILQGVVESSGTDVVPFTREDIDEVFERDHTVIQFHVMQHSGGQQQPQPVGAGDHESQGQSGAISKWRRFLLWGMRLYHRLRDKIFKKHNVN